MKHTFLLTCTVFFLLLRSGLSVSPESESFPTFRTILAEHNVPADKLIFLLWPNPPFLNPPLLQDVPARPFDCRELGRRGNNMKGIFVDMYGDLVFMERAINSSALEDAVCVYCPKCTADSAIQYIQDSNNQRQFIAAALTNLSPYRTTKETKPSFPALITNLAIAQLRNRDPNSFSTANYHIFAAFSPAAWGALAGFLSIFGFCYALLLRRWFRNRNAIEIAQWILFNNDRRNGYAAFSRWILCTAMVVFFTIVGILFGAGFEHNWPLDDAINISHIDQMKGLNLGKLAVLAHSSEEWILRRNFGYPKTSTIPWFRSNSLSEMMNRLLDGTVDYIVSSDLSLQKYIWEHMLCNQVIMAVLQRQLRGFYYSSNLNPAIREFIDNSFQDLLQRRKGESFGHEYEMTQLNCRTNSQGVGEKVVILAVVYLLGPILYGFFAIILSSKCMDYWARYRHRRANYVIAP